MILRDGPRYGVLYSRLQPIKRALEHPIFTSVFGKSPDNNTITFRLRIVTRERTHGNTTSDETAAGDMRTAVAATYY